MPARPPTADGSGARRVHRTTPSASASPEATPRVNGSPGSAGAGGGVVVGAAVVVGAGDVRGAASVAAGGVGPVSEELPDAARSLLRQAATSVASAPRRKPRRLIRCTA